MSKPSFNIDAVILGKARLTDEQALEIYRQSKPDVVLMDLRLPGMGGVEAIIAIRKEFPEVFISALTIRAKCDGVNHRTNENALGSRNSASPVGRGLANLKGVAPED